MTPTRAEWSILVYIAAHNDLATHGETSLRQLIAAGSTPQVRLTALYDKAMGATRYDVGTPGQAAEEPLGRFDSGDPDALLQTVQWAFECHRARRYGLVLWSHGTGYWDADELKRILQAVHGEMVAPERDEVTRAEPAERAAAARTMALFRTTLEHIMAPKRSAERAILYDNGTQHAVDTLELERVAREVAAFIGQPIDLLGMDACLMGNLEVAYQLRAMVGTMVASEELVPATSWPYPSILAALHAAPDMSAADLARRVVADYLAFYRSQPPALNGGDVTKVALDLAHIESVAPAARALAEALVAHMDTDFAALHRAQFACLKRETRDGRRETPKTKFGCHLWDVGTLARHLAGGDAQPSVRAAASELDRAVRAAPLVLAQGHEGNWFDGIGGLSVYMSPPDKPQSSEYANLAFALDTGWDRMLAAYRERVELEGG